MEAQAAVQDAQKAVAPIPFINAVLELQDWVVRQGIDCPGISAANSAVEDDGRWALYDEDDKLIARVGYDANGNLSVL